MLKRLLFVFWLFAYNNLFALDNNYFDFFYRQKREVVSLISYSLILHFLKPCVYWDLQVAFSQGTSVSELLVSAMLNSAQPCPALPCRPRRPCRP